MADNPSDRWEYPGTEHGAAVPPKPTAPPAPAPAKEATVEIEPEPEPRSRVADDLLLLFGRLAAALLGGVVLLTGLLAIFRPTADLAAIYTLLNTQLSLIIGAVLGYAAHPQVKDR